MALRTYLRDKDAVTEWLLRIALAFAFLYPPVSAWLNPYAWVGYFPTLLLDLSSVSDITLLHIFGIIEIAIAVWILMGRKILVPSSAAFVALCGIVAFNWGQMDVLFRDIPIALIALALMARHYPLADS